MLKIDIFLVLMAVVECNAFFVTNHFNRFARKGRRFDPIDIRTFENHLTGQITISVQGDFKMTIIERNTENIRGTVQNFNPSATSRHTGVNTP